MKAIAAVALVCAAVAVAVTAVSAQYAPNVPYSAVYDSNSGKWSVVAGCDGAGWSACATMDDGVWSTGWYTLNVRSNPSAADEYQAFGAGYVEGALTATHQWDAWRTWVNGTAYVWPDDAVKQFALRQDQWVRATAANPTDGNAAYWAQVNALYKQWDGLMAGYNDNAEADQQLAYDQWLAYQLQEEIGDIMVALNLSDSEQLMNPNVEHCSSLVRLTPDRTRLFASHDTWSGFSSMLRIFKHFDLHFQSVPGTAATGVSFSSFPGAIPSIDDYYVTSANLIVMETTNGVMNNTLYQLYTTTETVPYWARVTVANRMSASGAEWMTYFALYNSGTYNNQWIVVDNKQFSSGAAQPLAPGALWIGEQIPGYVVTADMTATLQGQGFWSSYNIPYFPFVYNISGYWPFYEKYGNTYSWAHCARANIFRRDAPKVETLDDMKHLMRYNEWQTDPLSLADACRGISARCDLNPPWASNPLNSYSAFGAIDSKISTDQLAPSRATLAVCGPTWDAQAPFAWTKQWEGVPRYGQPNVFDFDWTTLVPQQP